MSNKQPMRVDPPHRLLRAWLVVGVTVAILFAAWIGWAAANGGGGGSTSGGQETKIGRTSDSGQMQAMHDRHQVMTEEMRVDASPPMLQQMNANPMWQQMRNDAAFTKMMEDQQRQIDRMLGRGAP